MSPRDSRYDILFEPVKIGPVIAKNRFYQVPHCTGMGRLRPHMVAALRGMKAEGGWGVVCTEYCSIHPSSDDTPYPSHALWDDSDIKTHRLMTEQVHAHGALTGVELWFSGSRSANLLTRETPMDVASLPNGNGDPFQSRAMSKSDIRELRRWHRESALRAKAAGFDIVYVYATHHYLLDNFLNPTVNTRTDEYGGSQSNRMRLIRELIEETKDAVVTPSQSQSVIRLMMEVVQMVRQYMPIVWRFSKHYQSCRIYGISIFRIIHWRWVFLVSSRKRLLSLTWTI